MDLGLYNLHYVLGLFGKPENVKYYANIERNIDTSGVLMIEYQNFNAMCVCAKDSEGKRIGVIQGSEGKIISEEAPSLVGKVTLKMYDGTTESFDDRFSKDRVVPEFKAFIRALNENDLEVSVIFVLLIQKGEEQVNLLTKLMSLLEQKEVYDSIKNTSDKKEILQILSKNF